jgi:dUTP pyrophosphatase
MEGNQVKVKVKKLDPAAILPGYATVGAACFDLHALIEGDAEHLVGSTLTVRTGLAFEIPQGWGMFIFSRSGHGFKNDVRLANCVGVIDSDYRGEVSVKLTSDMVDECAPMLKVKNGDRIAQAMIVQLPTIAFIEAEDLTETERGEGGFGSTGQ